jgi:hypothetical protein
VVIECGQAGEAEADRRAEVGARDYLSAEDVVHPDHANGTQLYKSVARIHVPLDIQLAFDEGRSVADVTISPTIDQYNFQLLEAGSRLAYCNERGRLLAIGSDGRDATDEYLETRDGAIYLRRSIVPVMMTTDAVAAKSDCLLYAAKPVEYD